MLQISGEELNLMMLKNEILMDMLCQHTAEVHRVSQENSSLKLNLQTKSEISSTLMAKKVNRKRLFLLFLPFLTKILSY